MPVLATGIPGPAGSGPEAPGPDRSERVGIAVAARSGQKVVQIRERARTPCVFKRDQTALELNAHRIDQHIHRIDTVGEGPFSDQVAQSLLKSGARSSSGGGGRSYD